MTAIDPTNSNTPGAGASPGPSSPAPYKPGDMSSDSGWGAFESYLGPKNFEVFKANVCRAISTQIKHEEQRAQKISDQLKRSETGKSIYDN